MKKYKKQIHVIQFKKEKSDKKVSFFNRYIFEFLYENQYNSLLSIVIWSFDTKRLHNMLIKISLDIACNPYNINTRERWTIIKIYWLMVVFTKCWGNLLYYNLNPKWFKERLECRIAIFSINYELHIYAYIYIEILSKLINYLDRP